MKGEEDAYNVSAVALHQAISAMSLELRIAQEKLAQQRRDFKGEKVDPLLIQRSKVYNSLKDERDHWKKECGLLWCSSAFASLRMAFSSSSSAAA